MQYCTAVKQSNVAQMRKAKKEAVIELLKRNTDGLTIIEIAKLLKISRNTVTVALAELKGEGRIRIRPVGMAKLHYWQGEVKRNE